ncbi:hypothetical protein ACKWTF_007423 [Chironomus riparius]
MVPVTVILIYIVVASFLVYTFRNKKPLKWSDIFLNGFPMLKVIKNDNIYCIPGPLRLPFIGTKWQQIKMNKLHEYYADLNKTYGNIVMEMNGNIPVISLFKREDIEKVLQFNSAYPFRPPTEIVSFYRQKHPERYSSLGLVNEQGPQWAKLRSKLTPKTLESKRMLSTFCPELNEICDEFINAIKQKRNANNVLENFDDLMKMMSLEASSSLILGRRMGYLQESGENNENFMELGNAAKNIFAIFRDAFYGNCLWKYFPSRIYKEYAANEEKIYNIILEIIKNTIQNNEFMAQDKENESILVKILKTEGLDIRDKISGVIDFLTATQVLSHTAIFLLSFISSNAEVQEKIFQESSLLSENPSLDELNKAHYTRAAIQESFRISPSAFAVARILEQDFNLSGYHVEAGNIVLCHNMIACNNEENFENAKEFIPERWLNENGEMNPNQPTNSSIVVPFGCGRRTCPGKKLSEMELVILVIKLVREFKIEYMTPCEQQFEFVLAPRGPINIKFENRV